MADFVTVMNTQNRENTCDDGGDLLVSVVYGLCNLVQALFCALAHGGPWVEVELSESQGTTSAQLIHQHGLALLKHIYRAGQTRGQFRVKEMMNLS